MSVSIEITNGKFSKNSISIHRGKHLLFKSADGKDYTVDCGKDDADISDDFPFSVPGDNKDHKLKIKDKAVKKNYTCTVKQDTPAPADPDDLGSTPPTMIIKVE